MGKEQPEYIAHQYGMRRVSLKFMHARSGHMHALLGLGVDLFTDVIMAVLATPCLKVSESVALTEKNDNQVQNSVSLEKMDAIGRDRNHSFTIHLIRQRRIHWF